MRHVGIDPSTKTGLVILNDKGETIFESEIQGEGKKDPKRMRTMIDSIVDKIELTDFVLIEGFGFSSLQAIQTGGIGWGIRMLLDYHGIGYTEVSPLSVKKFVGARSHVGEKGHMKRLKGPEIKKEMARATLETLGYTHKNNNIVDAYVMARIAFVLNSPAHRADCNAEQHEVINLLRGEA